MGSSSARSILLAGILLAGILPAGKGLAAGPPPGSQEGFSGTWSLKSETGGALTRAADAPLEAVGDAHRLAIADDGAKLEITYPTGRKRVFYTDGLERELDDGDGPAKVVARRKGGRVVVSSEWQGVRGLKETWSLLSSPRLLVVEANVTGRHAFPYRRVYEPSTEPPPTPTAPLPPPAVPVPSPAARPMTATTPAPTSSAAAGTAARPECAIRPPRGTKPAELAAMAKISAAEAERRATASVAPQRVTSVIFSDLEVDDGCLVWPFDLRLEGRSGVQEILIDAGDGKVISSTFEAADTGGASPKSP